MNDQPVPRLLARTVCSTSGWPSKPSATAARPANPAALTSGTTWSQVCRRCRSASREGWQKYLDDPAPSNAVMAKLNTSMDLQTFADAAAAQARFIATEDTKARGLGTMTKERWETLAKQLGDLGVLAKAPNIDEILAQDP